MLTLVGAGLIIMIQPLCAQSIDDYLEVARDVLKTEKKAAVAEAMQLTEAESGPFWELYNEYNAELYKVHTDRVNIIKNFKVAMTDEEADAAVNNIHAYQSKLIALNKAYYKKFKKIMPASRVARYFQIENKIDALINFRLAQEIPLIESSN